MSRLIKSHFSSLESEKKLISIRVFENPGQKEQSFSNSVTEEEKNKILEQATIEAENIISMAQAEARELQEQISYEKQNWEMEKEALIKEAKSQGFEQGLKQGQIQGYDEYHSKLKLAQETVEASKRDYYHHIEGSEKVILELGITVAGKILGKSITEHEEDFLLLVKRAIKNARDYKEVQLHIHPKHYSYILSQKDELLSIFPRDTDFYVYPDDDLPENSCLIESENGRIDAGVDSQLEEIKLKLIEMLECE